MRARGHRLSDGLHARVHAHDASPHEQRRSPRTRTDTETRLPPLMAEFYLFSPLLLPLLSLGAPAFFSLL